MSTYAARYWREGDAWEVELVDDPRVHTFASTLGRARRYIAEATAAMYDLDPRAVTIVDDIELPPKLAQITATATATRQKAEQVTAEAAEQTTAAARALVANGLSMRDAGELIHLSHQRVAQLLGQP